MNIHTCLSLLTAIWFAGGILLLPFNSLFLGFLCSLKLEVDYEKVWLPSVKISWFYQIIWNLIFFSLSLLLGQAEKHTEIGKITYTLTRIDRADLSSLNWTVEERASLGKIWQYRFYSETEKGKIEIPNDSPIATPFQKAMRNRFHEELDNFHELPYAEATAFIDRYNAAHPTNTGLLEGILVVIASSIAAPFLWLIPDMLGISAVLCPILMLICFGPIILALIKAR